MAWKIYFWAVAVLLLGPLPIKLVLYALGKGKNPRAVMVEEVANGAFFAIGMVGLYGFVTHTPLLVPLFWRAWVVLAVVVSLGSLWWSPKIRHADAVLGRTLTRVVIAVGSLVFIPMLVALWQYAAAGF